MWQLGFFVQDGWRWKPNLTVNAGLRYEVQLPFYALNNSYSVADIDDIFGPTGPGTDLTVGSTVTGLGNLFKPGVLQGSPTTYDDARRRTRTRTTPTRTTSRRASARRGRPAPTSGLMRTHLRRAWRQRSSAAASTSRTSAAA